MAIIYLENYALQASLSRYLKQNITPYQQFILDLQENFEAMTFNKVADAQLTQFKFIRIPKEKVMLDVIRTMQKEDDLIDCIKEFFTPEIARFKKTFKTEDITEASEEVSNINLQKAATLGHGILLHLSTNSKYIPPRLFSSFIDKLLDNGLNINNSFIDRTALHYATAKGNFAAVKLLLEKGADPTIPNKYGITPLDLAATGKNPNIVKLLMEAMMKLNNRNSIHYPLIQSGDKKGKEDKAPDILIEELRKLYIQNNTSRQKRKLEVIENSTAKRSKVEMQDSQVHPKSILENITLADIALQEEKYKMTLITDPAARVTPLVMNKKSKGVVRGF
ncbi:ankyrin repeat domain-containing protein [Candidatus Tisiphia endosymbiont of Beris chalybata]|uniref:ankyrin repeat domain-containing protein n=1 Tax=Candidatus Tisiphia endosymbiont of Beris chalybata TaxID=3066262 RepID=UPI00312CC090